MFNLKNAIKSWKQKLRSNPAFEDGDIAERMTQSNCRINGLIWDDLQRIEYNVSAELSEFHKPVLIIQGKQDILRERSAREAVQVFPNAELVMLDRCGHYGWLDRPERYLDEILSFKERVESYTATVDTIDHESS